LLRLTQIIGDRRRGIPPIIPVSRTTWLEGVRTGRFPQPVREIAGVRVTAWRVEDIRAMLDAAAPPRSKAA
jgi:predicted DNA-binding transcriptional regulator AlpA